MLTNNTHWPYALLRFYLILAVPVVLVLASVRLVMTPLFLQIEYHRPGFPVDYYGMTTDERLSYAPFALDYLIYNHDLSYLADLRFPDSTPMYNERELSHMGDVQRVVQAAFLLGAVAAPLTLAAVVILWRAARAQLVRALRAGSLLTLGMIAAIVFLAVTSWNFFFTQFHELFFAEGTWIFLYSDTLIRLFPEQFWFDAALTIGGLTVLAALLLLLLTWRWRVPPDF
ncbi:MAG: TIGR01906 family membrane protein [Chloroflexi bacterium]|nr:TIGR01906 family membrane protein [Chloroflexota bacterium]